MAGEPTVAPSANADEPPMQVLTFSLDDEQYAVDILRVREIRGWTPVTKIPQTPRHMLGVLNLRGSIVPIMDLRLKMGLTPIECTPLTVTIVFSIEMDGEQRQCGLVVDRVSDVVDITPAHRRPMPAMDSKADCSFISALAVVADAMIIILNIRELMCREEHWPSPTQPSTVTAH